MLDSLYSQLEVKPKILAFFSFYHLIPWGIFTQFSKNVYTETKVNGLIFWESGDDNNYFLLE